METTIQHVTCNALLIQHILDQYKDNSETFVFELKQIASQYNVADPESEVPLEHFNILSDWIEKNLGPANLKKIGNVIGQAEFNKLNAENLLPGKIKIRDSISELIKVMNRVVHDPENGKYELDEPEMHCLILKTPGYINATIQQGIIEYFIRKADVVLPQVRQIKTREQQHGMCEYEITWM
ncbi:MAG: hypothetical protein JXJ22_01720 [Bacteroidales bacterium]|nr:hypothetical protein [Bacteroidales bacterium]